MTCAAESCVDARCATLRLKMVGNSTHEMNQNYSCVHIFLIYATGIFFHFGTI